MNSLSLYLLHFQVKALSQFITEKRWREMKYQKGLRGIRTGTRALNFAYHCWAETSVSITYCCLVKKCDDFESFASYILYKVCETQRCFDSCTWNSEMEVEMQSSHEQVRLAFNVHFCKLIFLKGAQSLSFTVTRWATCIP